MRLSFVYWLMATTLGRARLHSGQAELDIEYRLHAHSTHREHVCGKRRSLRRAEGLNRFRISKIVPEIRQTDICGANKPVSTSPSRSCVCASPACHPVRHARHLSSGRGPRRRHTGPRRHGLRCMRRGFSCRARLCRTHDSSEPFRISQGDGSLRPSPTGSSDTGLGAACRLSERPTRGSAGTRAHVGMGSDSRAVCHATAPRERSQASCLPALPAASADSSMSAVELFCRCAPG